jgi:hypothetical protein
MPDDAADSGLGVSGVDDYSVTEPPEHPVIGAGDWAEDGKLTVYFVEGHNYGASKVSLELGDG